MFISRCGTLTVANNEDVDSKNGEAFAYSIIRILEFTLHNGAINLRNYNTGDATQKHSVLVISMSSLSMKLFRLTSVVLVCQART